MILPSSHCNRLLNKMFSSSCPDWMTYYSGNGAMIWTKFWLPLNCCFSSTCCDWTVCWLPACSLQASGGAVSLNSLKPDLESKIKNGPATGPNWNPAQGEAPRPDNIIDAMVCSQKKETYHDCPLKDPTSSWKSQMQIFTLNQWTEAANPCGWIREMLEEAEEKGNPLGRLADSTNLDPTSLTCWATNQAVYISWYEAPNTYTAEDCQVCTQRRST